MALVEEKDKCKKENRVPPKSLSDISGNRYGRLVAEYPVFDGTRWRWHCKCDCGKSKDVIPPDLKRGMVKSCGCFRIDFRKKDLTGMRFNHLTVLRVADDDMKHHGQRWVCKCDCGKEVVIRCDGLQSGHTRSCGCENKRRETHGRSKTKLFKTWTAMKQRCQNVNCNHYKNYAFLIHKLSTSAFLANRTDLLKSSVLFAISLYIICYTFFQGMLLLLHADSFHQELQIYLFHLTNLLRLPSF